MKATLLGVQKLDFTTDKGEQVVGTKIFCAFPHDNVMGLCTDNYFLRDNVPALPKEAKINESINLYFNRKGKIEAISV